MFKVTAPLLSRQWTAAQIRFFKNQKLRSLHAEKVRKSKRPKYMPSWTRHDIWTDDTYVKKPKTIQTATQTNENKATEQKQQQQAPKVTKAQEEPEKKDEEKKSKFKFW